MSSLPKKTKKYLRDHLSDILGTCLWVISERPREEGLLDIFFPIKMGGLFDLSGFFFFIFFFCSLFIFIDYSFVFHFHFPFFFYF